MECSPPLPSRTALSSVCLLPSAILLGTCLWAEDARAGCLEEEAGGGSEPSLPPSLVPPDSLGSSREAAVGLAVLPGLAMEDASLETAGAPAAVSAALGTGLAALAAAAGCAEAEGAAGAVTSAVAIAAAAAAFSAFFSACASQTKFFICCVDSCLLTDDTAAYKSGLAYISLPPDKSSQKSRCMHNTASMDSCVRAQLDSGQHMPAHLCFLLLRILLLVLLLLSMLPLLILVLVLLLVLLVSFPVAALALLAVRVILSYSKV